MTAIVRQLARGASLTLPSGVTLIYPSLLAAVTEARLRGLRTVEA